MIEGTIGRARLARRLARTLGPGWMLYRARHGVEMRAGLIARRLPAVGWDDAPLGLELADTVLADPETYLDYRRSGAPAFFFSPGDRARLGPLLRGFDTAASNPAQAADELMAGRHRLFSQVTAELGASPAWNRNALTGQEIAPDRHWSRLDDFAAGDIKVIWEPSRFGFVYDLVRAFWRSNDETYAERFWALVEGWRVANPPQLGPNWKCGQETSLRVMAWCFGLHGFLDAAATTPERVTMLAGMIARSGHRIAGMVDYALSQENNHGVSEGMGLWTIGLLFPELRRAGAWRERGRAILERLGRELIYDDGAFSQQSLNYQRLVLDAYVWAMRLAELAGTPLSRVLYDRVGTSADLLYQLQDEVTGRVPCYGANDGALILPLSNTDYVDYRPAVQAARQLTSDERAYPPGPWDEASLWLFGEEPKPVAAAPARVDRRTAPSGYVALRSASGFAFTRCGAFRHRPSHADLLHLDLWWRGINVALDPGTFSYNSPAPWDGGLAGTAVHNTLTVDGRDQMDKVGRFLWLPWARGTSRPIVVSDGGALAYWEGEHDGYARLPSPATHRRGVLRIGDEHWLVLDESRSGVAHDHRLHWLLADQPYAVAAAVPGRADGHDTVTLDTPAGRYAVAVGSLGERGQVEVVRGDPAGTRGWRSAYYLDREPAVSVTVESRAATLRLWTLLGPAGALVDAGGDAIWVEVAGTRVRVALGRTGTAPLVTGVSMAGDRTDELVVGR